MTSPLDFIRRNPVFTLEQYRDAYGKMDRSPAVTTRALAYHVQEGRLVHLRRGLYAHNGWVDPWLLASKLAEDAIISHDGALSFHKLTGVGHQVSFMTTSRVQRVDFNDIIFNPLRTKTPHPGAKKFEGTSGPLMVTTLATTLVDCLAMLERAPEPIALLDLFVQSKPNVDAWDLIDHARTYESPLLMSRLGFFLMCARYALGDAAYLTLGRLGVKKATYFNRRMRSPPESLISKWKLLVSGELASRWYDAIR